ncbi:MAG: TlpA family protein disulfide reductase [Clostridiaceae bacterium]|nr:TlpA family protein disulfide reductase [Clostridiaceae bacterium]
MIQKPTIQLKMARPALALALVVLLLTTLLLSTACAKKQSDNQDQTPPVTTVDQSAETQPPGGATTPTQTENIIKAYDFTLQDQFGIEHTLSEYEGKVIFLNFWATWCPPCKVELPDIEGLYKDYNANANDLVVLGVIFPDEGNTGSSSQREKNVEGIKQFLQENDLTFPVLMDTQGEVFNEYGVTGLPTTFIIDREGYFVGYAPGALPRELMDYYVEQAIGNNDA